MNQEPDRPSHPLRHSLRNAAILLMALIVLSTAMTLWTNSPTAHALKFRIEKRFQENREAPAAAEEHEGTDENVIFRKITDPAELAALQRQIPELLLPEKLPEGYAFSFAEADYNKIGGWLLRYYCKNQDDLTLSIVEGNNSDESEIRISMRAEEMEVSGRKIYYIEENDFIRGVFYMVDDISVVISGAIEKEKLIKIAKELE